MLKYTLNFIPNRFMVFGCGGTGSRFIPLLAQFIKTLNFVMDPEILLFDFDQVEQKNLLRQNFVAPDVGKNKAEVLAQRYSRAYGIPIIPYTEDITKEGLSKEASNRIANKNLLVFLCVDSVEARQRILQKLLIKYKTRNCIIMDSGNENDFGQVTIMSSKECVNPSSNELPSKSPIDLDIPFIPANLNYFIQMKPPAETRSCADLDQTMAINSLVANVMFSVVQNLFFSKPISFNRVNISLQHGCIPEYMHPSLLGQTGSSHVARETYGFGAEYLDMGLIREFLSKHEEFERMMKGSDIKEDTILKAA